MIGVDDLNDFVFQKTDESVGKAESIKEGPQSKAAKVLISDYAWIPIDQVNNLERLKSILTIIPRKYIVYGNEPAEPLYLYREKEGRIGIPRQYFVKNNIGRHDFSVLMSKGKDLDRGSYGEKGIVLREEQRKALDVFLLDYNSGGLGGILVAHPGWGKTVWGTNLIREIGKQTIIVVHKEFLMNQWMAALKKTMPGVRVGVIQQDRLESDADVVIALIQTLIVRNFGLEFYQSFGLVVTDEVHRIGSEVWSQVVPKFTGYRVGLTATPRRGDSAENVFFWHIGNIVFKSSEKPMTALIKFVNTDIFYDENRFSKATLLTILSNNFKRNLMIAANIVSALIAKDGRRKIIVVSERLAQLQKIAELLRTMAANKNIGYTVGYYVGGREQSDLDVVAMADVIFATRQMVNEGLDIPKMDTLVLATPMSDVEQVVGRILRNVEGKKIPVVVDLVDKCFVKSLEWRKGFYKKQGWIRG
jgi:superfamily II DNA or RNA helicase